MIKIAQILELASLPLVGVHRVVIDERQHFLDVNFARVRFRSFHGRLLHLLVVFPDGLALSNAAARDTCSVGAEAN